MALSLIHIFPQFGQRLCFRAAKKASPPPIAKKQKRARKKSNEPPSPDSARESFSIGYFNEKFKSEGINAEYVNFEIPQINDFMEVIEENPNLRGLNVTIPYKERCV